MFDANMLLEEFEKYKEDIKRVAPGLFYQLLEFKDSQSVGTCHRNESCDSVHTRFGSYSREDIIKMMNDDKQSGR